MMLKKNIRTCLMAGLALCAAGTRAYTTSVKPGEDLTKVRDGIRADRKAGKIKPTESITVLFTPGVYSIPGTFFLTQEDSGTPSQSVTWKAEKPNTVTLVGGTPIPATAFKPVTDATRLQSFAPEVRAKIRVADVSTILKGELKPWPDAYRGMPPAPWLYLDGEPLEIARWPDKDWTTFTNVLDSGLTDDPKNEFAARPGIFYLENAVHSARWNLDEGVWADGYWKHDWDEEVLRLASYDPVKHTASPRKIHLWGLLGKGTCGMHGRRFKIVNVAAELDAPGEWWLDRKAKLLYYLPVIGKENRSVTLVPESPALVQFSKASYITFENLAFAYSHGKNPGVLIDGNSSFVTMRKCCFANFGDSALYVSGHDNRITECLVEKTGSFGISLGGGDRKYIVNAANVVDHTEIRTFGRFQRTACGITVHGCGNAVRDCNIHHGAAQSLTYGGNEHLFANNDFHHVLLEACDAGAVYTGYDTASQGNLLFGNFTHELGDDPAFWPYRNGFYFDDCDWGDDVIGNRFRNTGPAIFIGSGNMHRVHNNLVTDALTAFHCDSRGVTWERRLRGSFLLDPDERSWAESLVVNYNYRAAPWHVAYPQIAEVIDDRPNLPHANEVSGNLFVNCKHPWSLDSRVKALLDEMPLKDNNVLMVSNTAAFVTPPQPISFRDAVDTIVKSPDGKTCAKFYLDVAGRLSWQADWCGTNLISRTALGVTVGHRDYGKLAIPGKAKCRTVKDLPPVAGTLKDDSDFDHPLNAKGYCEAIIPVSDLITGRESACLETRVFSNGVAFRWRVPGTGRRKVVGEMTTWCTTTAGKLVYRKRTPYYKPRNFYIEIPPRTPADGVWIIACDAERGTNPRFRLQDRAAVTGVVFPDAPSGWSVEGEILTPWRVTLFE